MKTDIKIELEKFLIANQTTYKQYFMGQELKNVPDKYYTVKFVPKRTTRVSTGVVMHEGTIRFFAYAKNPVNAYKMYDYLASILNEKVINIGTLHIDLDMCQSGTLNRFSDMTHYELSITIKWKAWTPN